MENKGQNTVQSKNSNIKAGRRALLGAISAAGVVGSAKLPGQWTRPVVDHVLLPAHAATTDDAGSSPTGGTSTFITTVTSNCVVTCTSAFALISVETATSAGTLWSLYSCTAHFYYQQCPASGGGVTSTYSCSVNSDSGAFSCSSDYSQGTFYCGSTAVYTNNAVCNVTVTSS